MFDGLQPLHLIIIIGLGVLIVGGLGWYLFGWRNRTIRQPDKIVEVESPQEQTTIEPATGRLLDPEAAQMIGDPRIRWGVPVRRRYLPEEYEDKIKCLTCGRAILPGQFFWETPLIDRESGQEINASFQLCLSCQPGDIAAAAQS